MLMLLEEAAVAEEALLEPLGIIEPVDADDRPAARRASRIRSNAFRAPSLATAWRNSL
jgi:hypothetical protein